MRFFPPQEPIAQAGQMRYLIKLKIINKKLFYDFSDIIFPSGSP